MVSDFVLLGLLRNCSQKPYTEWDLRMKSMDH